MIFGILGSFGIEIGTRKNVGRKIFRQKKIRKLLVENIFGTKNFRFFVDFFFVEKVNEIQNFEISSFFSKKFEISKF